MDRCSKLLYQYRIVNIDADTVDHDWRDRSIEKKTDNSIICRDEVDAAVGVLVTILALLIYKGQVSASYSMAEYLLAQGGILRATDLKALHLRLYSKYSMSSHLCQPGWSKPRFLK